MKSGPIAALKSAGRAAITAVRRAALGAPLFAALLGAALPVGAHASNPASLDIDVDFSGIANISNLTASSGTAPGTIDLSWTEPYRNAGVAPYAYDIRVSSIAEIPNETAFSTSSALSAVSPSLPPSPPGTGGGATGFVVTGLTPGVTYYFAIHEHDSGSVSDYWIRSPALHLNATNYALAAAGAPSAPAAAALLTSSSFSVTGDWTLSTGATDYVLAASTNAALPPVPVAASSTTVASTATVAGLAPNTTYYFAVSACEQGCSAFTAVGSTITAAAPALSLSTTSVSSAAVSLAWNPDGNPAGTQYRVLVSTDGVDYTTALTTASPAATASGLNASTTYYFEVVALNGAGTPASVAGPVQVYTPTGAPAAPAGGSPIAVYQSSATAAWSLSTGATDYVLAAALSAVDPPTAIAASSTTTSSTATLTGLGPNATYYFFVSACDLGCSSYAAIGSTITDAAAALALSTTSVSSNSISVAWGADGNPAGTQYKVEISTDGVDFTLALSTNSTAGTFGGISANTTYYIEAVAVNDAGVAAAPSNVVEILTPLGTPAAPAGGAPGTVYTSSATATWALSAGATDYVLAASLNPGNPPNPVAASTTTLTSTGTLTGLGPNTTYYLFVSACAGGCSAYTSIGSTITDAAAALSLSTTSVSSNTISVAWNADGNPAGTQYKVEISTDGVDFTLALSTTSTAGTFGGIAPNTTYYLEAVAVNNAGVAAAPSNVVQILTPLGTPAAPAGGAPGTVYASSATATWALSAGATDYVLAASLNAGNPPSPVAASTTTLTSTGTLTGLGPNTTYYLFVSACAGGCSAYTSIGSTITDAAPALSLSTTSVSSSAVSVAWNADGNPAGTQYKVEISTDGVDFSAFAATTGLAATATGLGGNTTYYFEAVAVNGAGIAAAPSNVVKVVTLPGPPAAPTSGAPGTVYTSSATATWALSAGATDYVLSASLNSANPPSPIASSSTTVASTGTVTGLGPNTTYYFFVSACGFGCSSYTSIGSTITDAASPIGLSTTSVSSNSISVAWSADGNPAGTQYKVEISTDGVDFTAFAATAGLTATATGLSGNTTYYFETVALNGADVASAPSNVVRVVTPAGPPAPPAGVTVIATSSATATEAWSLTAGATDYALAASLTSANPPSPAASTATATGNSGVLTGLGPNATYYLFVAACGDGCSAYAAAGSTVTAAAPAVNLSTTAVFFNTVSLAWGADGNPTGTFYRVLVSTDGVDYAPSGLTTATSDAVGGLAGGATYYFEIVALNAANSPVLPSAPVRVVTPTVPTIAQVPMEPLGVTVTASSTSVHLAWSPTTRYTAGLSFVSTGTPVAGELEGYAIFRSTQICGPEFVQVSTIGPVASPSFTDATGGVSYYYRLFSYNTVGLSTGVVTVSPLGERYFFTDDCVTVLAVDPQTATGTNGLVGATNGLGGDVRISRTRRPQDDGVDILQSAQWYAFLNGVTFLPSYVLPAPGHYTLRVTTQPGSVAPDLQPIDLTSPFGGVVAPIAGANSATPIDDLGAFWFNNQDYVKQYGRIDPLADVVTLDSPNLGIYQVRSQGRTASGPVFDVSNISGRIITPGAPGRNSVWIFTYDPGPNNVVPTGRVYDLRGEHVADLQPGLVPNSLTWDGRMNGRGVTSGVYIYHISGGGKTFSGTIVVAK